MDINKKIKFYIFEFLIIFLIIIGVYYFIIDIYFLKRILNIENDTIEIYIKIIGVILIFGGLYLNSERIKEVRKSNNTAEKGQNIDRFNNSLNNLSKNNLISSLGGIYGMIELIESDSKNYKKICYKLLKERLENTSVILINDRSIENYKEYDIEQSIRDTLISYVIIDEKKLFSNINRKFSSIIFDYFDFANEKYNLIETEKKNTARYIQNPFENTEFSYCYFYKNDFITKLQDTTFKNCIFKDVKFTNDLTNCINVLIIGSNFINITYFSGSLNDIILEKVYFANCQFQKENFSNSNRDFSSQGVYFDFSYSKIEINPSKKIINVKQYKLNFNTRFYEN